MPLTQIEGVPLVSSLLDVLCRVSGMGLAILARISSDQWTACAVRDEIDTGIQPGFTLPTSMMLCKEVRDRKRLLVIKDITRDPDHCGDPFLVRQGFRSYIGVPIRLADGSVFGTLCTFSRTVLSVPNQSALDRVFSLFAELLADQIESADRMAASSADLQLARYDLAVSEMGRQLVELQLATSNASLQTTNSRLAASDSALLNAQATALLREQFVAVLGHDLRNPISAIAAGARLLRQQPLDELGRHVLDIMGQSTERMAELVRNMLDFALTQFGDGIPVYRRLTSDFGSRLLHVVEELMAKFPDRTVATAVELDAPLDCDPDRVGQLLSNLVANALTHGSPTQPVQVSAAVNNGWFTLGVSNGGVQIPATSMAGLFKPFVKGDRESREGLGLGLHIAAAIAHAHGGTLVATSTPDLTEFTFRMPTETSGKRTPDQNGAAGIR